MRHDGHKFVVILGHLYPTEQPENFENKNEKKKKKKKKTIWRYHHFTQVHEKL